MRLHVWTFRYPAGGPHARRNDGACHDKPLPLSLNDVLHDFHCTENIPIYKGGPLSTDTLFYLHTIEGIANTLPIRKGLYLNGDFEAIKHYILSGNPVKGKIRFFLGYSGWEYEQLNREIKENTWLINKESTATLMDETASNELWKKALCKMGGKYELWSRFPQIPTLN